MKLMLKLATLVSFLSVISYQTRAYEQFEFSIPNNNSDVEVCRIVDRFPGMNYSDEKEKKLCGIDFYNDPKTVICPKLVSTNPGVEVQDITKSLLTKEDYQKSQCKIKRGREGKKVAKFKQSISCSYTPSILAYYHISKLFGNILQVPPAVYRTMDIKEHEKIVSQGRRYSSGLINQIWNQYRAWKKRPNQVKYHMHLFTNNNTQIYGALSKNPRKEKWYGYLNGHRKNYDDKYNAFRRTYIYKNILTKDKPVAELIKREDSQKSLQEIIALKDMSDMLILDYMLDQNDRYGNMHYMEYFFQRDESGVFVKHKAHKVDPKLINETNAFKVKMLMLKDNDCGVRKGNRNRREGLTLKMRHVNPRTYYTTLWFNKALKRSDIKKYFIDELYFKEGNPNSEYDELKKDDWLKLIKNTSGIAKQLYNDCKKGKLRLDADVQAFMDGQEITDSQSHCELPEDFDPTLL